MAIRPRIIFAFWLQFVLLTSCGPRHEDSTGPEPPNRLQHSSSPYLQEHADNPVAWFEWGPEALEKAKKENKPLIISIGYSSCHWCHVMEEESFMDTAIARIMNENFVSIKVDREERPDIDQIYLEAAQLISGNSGWPLNAFALPNGKPFYAATYFPKQQWMALLQQVIKTYKNENSNVLKQAEALTKALHDAAPAATKGSIGLTQATYENIFEKWQGSFDFKSGGLIGAPKFPMPVIWEFMLQNYYLTNNKKALDIVTVTLDQMAQGGIYDHLGGGFARYSTDGEWKIPHFEKMLYDNGQLVSLYAHAYQVTRSPLYKEIITKTLDFVKREMTSPEAGFWSSINADSEGEEGKFYHWTKSEIDNLLDKTAAEIFNGYYNVSDSGNWEHGKNVLYAKMLKREFASEKKISEKECLQILTTAENDLLKARSGRIKPSTDTKILLSWNALMLKGYVDAYRALNDPEYLEAAVANARFLEENMLKKDGRLFRSFSKGKASIDGFLDDYALLAKAFIHLYQATFDIHWLDIARSVVEFASINFRNPDNEMFYYTSSQAKELIARKTELADNVIPSSNSVFAEVLYIVGQYYANDALIEQSTSMLDRIANEFTTDMPYYANWGSLLGLISFEPYEVAVMGPQSLDKSRELQLNYLPTTLFMGGESENLPLLKNKDVDGTMIYVCRNKTCKLPEKEVADALKQLLIRAENHL